MSWKHYLTSAALSLLSLSAGNAYAQQTQDEAPDDYDIVDLVIDDSVRATNSDVLQAMPDLTTRSGVKEMLSYSDTAVVASLASRWHINYSGVIGFSVGMGENSPLIAGVSHDLRLEALYVQRLNTNTVFEIGRMNRSLDNQPQNFSDIGDRFNNSPNITEGGFYGASIIKDDFNIVAGYEDENQGHQYGFFATSLQKGNMNYSAAMTTDKQGVLSVSHTKTFNPIDLHSLKIPLHIADFNSYSTLNHANGDLDINTGFYADGERHFEIADRKMLFEIGAGLEYETLRSSFNVQSQAFVGIQVPRFAPFNADVYLGASVNEKSETRLTFRLR